MSTAAERLEIRVDASDKEEIARAARMQGVGLSAFVREVSLREARRVVAAAATVTLSPEETTRFLAAFDAPFEPNERLQRAVERAAARRR